MTAFAQTITFSQAQAPVLRRLLNRGLAFSQAQAPVLRHLLSQGPVARQAQTMTLLPVKNPVMITFTDRSTAGPSGPILGRYWEFGDGTASRLTSPTHGYAPGTYTVSLTVTGTPPDGITRRSKTFTVSTQTTVGTPVPPTAVNLTANFTVSMGSSGTKTATFADISTPGPAGPITAWHWDFGDGNTSTAQNPPPHTYSSAGTKTITLTVTGSGSDGTAQKSTSVTFSAGGTPLDEFISYTNWSRPSFTPTRTRQYANATQFKQFMTELQPGDLIEPQPGCGEILIQSATSQVAYEFKQNLSSKAVIDLGTKKSVWNPGAASGDYIKFAYTGSNLQQSTVWIHACANLDIYGGYLAGNNYANGGIVVNAPSHHVRWYDAYMDNVGGSGLGVRGSTSSGATSACYDLDFRVEVNRFVMNPSLDNHADKGTGSHACILHGSTGAIYGTSPGSCRFAIYGHDSLRPGETSAGKTWPEGGGGSVIEQGNDALANYDNVYLYAYGENCLMEPGHVPANPGSTAAQTGGNILNMWGHIKLNGGKAWIWGVNCSGAMLHSDNGSWFPGSPAFRVEVGRAHHMNQWVHASNITVPYPTVSQGGTPLNIVYVDCTGT